MMYFKERSTQPELMDDLNLDEATLRKALKDIANVNRLLGGNNITLKAIDEVVSRQPNKEFTILDVGCGAGAMLRQVADFCRKKDYNVKLIGVDMNPKSLTIAETYSSEYPKITYKQLDIFKADEELVETDILLCTLTLHHFDCMDIVRFLKRFEQITRDQIIINDLQRSTLAYVLFSGFSRIFLKTRIARIDGLISIQRGFLKKDLVSYCKTLKGKSQIQWKWAFRYLWTITPGNQQLTKLN